MPGAERTSAAAQVAWPARQAVLCHCRAGFEPELAAELGERAALAGIAGHVRAERGSALVQFHAEGEEADRLDTALPWEKLIFARQKLQLIAELRALPRHDRVGALIAALDAAREREVLPRFGTLWLEHADSDAGRPLAGLARSLGNALRPALRKSGWLDARDDPQRPRLHVVLLDGDHALLARSTPGDSAPWPLGIPRLKMLPDAPSRSALKLEEAFLTLLDPAQREALLVPGMRAADLGAAPGGWSWVLARHHIRVSAIDNGPLQPRLLDSGLVTHVRADGFSWRPAQPLDWLVCDMVEQPARVARRMAEWFAHGWCRHALFNLKLPMKKRWLETRHCLQLFEQEAGQPLCARARQLYHDREEITVFASVAA
ncbi:23S rRNA (cytidine(2498)-2'-O)-methyltransferase RlmM [Luteimonas sp. e5]